MKWDPAYRDKHKDDIPASDSEDDEDDEYENYDYPTGPYVSGGQQKPQSLPQQNPTLSRTPAAPSASRAPFRGADKRGVDQDGFQRVQNKRPQQPQRPLMGANKRGVDHDGSHHVQNKRPQRPRVPRRMNFGVQRDNAAKAAFRRRDPPTGQFVLPRDCNEIEPNRVKMYDYFEELGVRLGSFIRPPQHIRDRSLLLWGNEEQIARTKAEISNWLTPSMQDLVARAKAKDKFANVYSTTGHKYKALQEKYEREAAIRKFQQEPPEGKVFKFTGSFLWPADEIAPTDLLGAGIEALDPLRLKYRCHITFDARLSAFKIQANKMESITSTLPRLQCIMKEYVARINRPIVRYYIDVPELSEWRKELKKVPYETGNPLAASPFLPLMTGKGMTPVEKTKWLPQRKDLKAQSDRGIEQALCCTIPNLRFYRGHLRMRVHFGTFALTSYRWPGVGPSIPFEDFMENLGIAGTKGTMIRE